MKFAYESIISYAGPGVLGFSDVNMVFSRRIVYGVIFAVKRMSSIDISADSHYYNNQKGITVKQTVRLSL